MTAPTPSPTPVIPGASEPSPRVNASRASQWRAEGRWLDKTVADFAYERALAQPDAVTHVSGATHLSAGEVWASANRLAAGLWHLGFRAGDVLAFQMPNWHECVFIDIAACLLGLVLCPIVPIYRDSEVKLILADSRAKGIFIAGEFRGFDHPAMIERIRPELPLLQHVWTVRGQDCPEHGLQQLLATGAPTGEWPAVSPDAVKLLLYTSGTTGRPKAVLHSHNTLARATLACAIHWNIAAGEVMIMPSPVTHVTGFCYGIELPFYRSTRTVFMEKWDATEAARLIELHQVAFTISATPFLHELVEVATRRATALSSLRIFACGGAAVPPSLIHNAWKQLPACSACRVYGSSETPMVTLGFIGAGNAQQAAETDGQVVDYEVRVIGPDGEPLASGQEGEICARGPAMFLGYADADQTREAFDAQGFFHSGDVGYLTPDNAVVFTGRIKDLINRGGEKISAKEVEDLLHRHPDIAEAAVVAMPHARLGETVCAFVIARPGADITADDVHHMMRHAGVARQKQPEGLFFVSEFPKTASGKVKKDLLRADVLRRLRDEA